MQNNIRVHFPRGLSGSFLINCIMYYTHPEYFLNLSLDPTGHAHPQKKDLSNKGIAKIFKSVVFPDNGSHSATKLDDDFFTIFIKCDKQDYNVVADMFLNKVLVRQIDLQKYNIMKGEDWAKFEEWTTCEFTKQEIKNMWSNDLELWNKKADFSLADYVLSFKDIHFDPTLNQRIAKITSKPINETVQQYIVDYRNANKRYWK